MSQIHVPPKLDCGAPSTRDCRSTVGAPGSTRTVPPTCHCRRSEPQSTPLPPIHTSETQSVARPTPSFTKQGCRWPTAAGDPPRPEVPTLKSPTQCVAKPVTAEPPKPRHCCPVHRRSSGSEDPRLRDVAIGRKSPSSGLAVHRLNCTTVNIDHRSLQQQHHRLPARSFAEPLLQTLCTATSRIFMPATSPTSLLQETRCTTTSKICQHQ
jgi:hypothetical protein